jgi:hypothetical protein
MYHERSTLNLAVCQNKACSTYSRMYSQVSKVRHFVMNLAGTKFRVVTIQQSTQSERERISVHACAYVHGRI